jgi:hypothetical protein
VEKVSIHFIYNVGESLGLHVGLKMSKDHLAEHALAGNLRSMLLKLALTDLLIRRPR